MAEPKRDCTYVNVTTGTAASLSALSAGLNMDKGLDLTKGTEDPERQNQQH
jgi:hypothetical protein